MMQISRVVAIFFLFFSFSIITSARLLHLPQRNEVMKAIEASPADSYMQIQEDDDLFNMADLVEVECDEKDEDCVKRRVIAEAHLDYIYTQSLKPKKVSP